tara:strand:+ start:1785 stop:1946 length:162 start_codon:yes stop_codon:yes gene_type:complete
MFKVAADPEEQYPPISKPTVSIIPGTPCLARNAPLILVNISRVKTLGLVSRKY